MTATMGALAPSHDVLTQMGAMMGVGGTIGAIISSRIAVSDLPQLVAAFHSFVGLAAVLTAIAKYLADVDLFADDPSGNVHKAAIFLGTFIGGVTFTGSLVAFGKLHGLLDSKALNLPIKNQLNIGMALANVAAMGWYMGTDSAAVGIPMLGKYVLKFFTCYSLVFARHILHTVLHTFLEVLTRRNCLTIESVFSW